MPALLDIDDLSKPDILTIWRTVGQQPRTRINGDGNINVAWSFEGNGIRTRTTFVQAFQQLGLAFVELPNFLKTSESVQDLAGYMDEFYDLYVLRDGNHERMQAFAAASQRPVINAMTALAHPCEVLTDAYTLHTPEHPLEALRILLWGPTTNVFRSWHALSRVWGLNLTQYCPASFHTNQPEVAYTDQPNGPFDLIITDAWPGEFADPAYGLSIEHLQAFGQPLLLPTPPVSVGRELLFPPVQYPRFAGYGQKRLLLPVQMAILDYFLAQQ